MRGFLIFCFSILLSSLTLFIERVSGIGWDFHPDSATYATVSLSIMDSIHQDPMAILNTAHYYWVAILGMNVGIGIACNMIFFGLTNSIIFKSVVGEIIKKNSYLLWMMFFFFIFNPYRLHLSTTLLKETIIIFLLTIIFVYSFRIKLLPLGLIFIWRFASLFYLTLLLPKRLYLVIWFLLLGFACFNFEYVHEFAKNQDMADMQFRDFDLVPAFKEYGFNGTLLRMLAWPLFALSGFYFIISPSVFFFPLVIGSIASLFVTYSCVSRFKFFNWFQIFTVLSCFAYFATGFTTYLRYVYPIISLLPLIFIYREANFKND